MYNIKIHKEKSVSLIFIGIIRNNRRLAWFIEWEARQIRVMRVSSILFCMVDRHLSNGIIMNPAVIASSCRELLSFVDFNRNLVSVSVSFSVSMLWLLLLAASAEFGLLNIFIPVYDIWIHTRGPNQLNSFVNLLRVSMRNNIRIWATFRFKIEP